MFRKVKGKHNINKSQRQEADISCCTKWDFKLKKICFLFERTCLQLRVYATSWKIYFLDVVPCAVLSSFQKPCEVIRNIKYLLFVQLSFLLSQLCGGTLPKFM